MSVKQLWPCNPYFDYVVAKFHEHAQYQDDTQKLENIENPSVVFLNLQPRVESIHHVVQEIADEGNSKQYLVICKLWNSCGIWAYLYQGLLPFFVSFARLEIILGENPLEVDQPEVEQAAHECHDAESRRNYP